MERKKTQKLKIVIIIFVVLLIFSIVALAGILLARYVLPPPSSTVEIPGNIIAPNGSNTSFQVSNMFPGDAITKYYRMKLSCRDDMTVHFRADIRPGGEKLAEVLKVSIRLSESDELLYDGLLRDIPKPLDYALHVTQNTELELYYEITAYLDTSVDNTYMSSELIADFHWQAEGTGDVDTPPSWNFATLCWWICPIFSLLLILILLLIVIFLKRRKGAKDES